MFNSQIPGQSRLVDRAGFGQGADAQLAIQRAATAFELAQRGAAVAAQRVELNQAAVDLLGQLVDGEVAQRRADRRAVLAERGVMLDQRGNSLQKSALPELALQ